MTGYVRQSAADIVPTGVVRAAPINNELNALRDAFATAGGHKHDGTAAEGHPVPVIGDSDLLNKIATDTGNNRHGVFVEVGGVAVEQVRFQDGAIVPVTDNDVDLGTSSLEFKDLHIDGTANIDSLVADTADINGGTVDNAVIGATTPAASNFTTVSASGQITSTVSTGTAPLVIASTTKVSNLNVDQLDGADWAAPAAIGTSTPAAGTFTSLTANTSLVAATADINGGTLDGAVIGASSAQAITGTTVTATTGFVGGLTGNVTGNTTGTHTGAVIGNVTGDVTGNVTASSGSSSFNDVVINGGLNMNAGTSATITNLTSPTNTNDAATKGYVDTSIANLIDSAPGALDTLNELAAALGDDASFSTTVTNSIATKLALAGGTMSGAIAMGTNKITGLGNPTANQDAATKTYVDTADALKLSLTGGTMSGAIAMGTSKITGLGTPTDNADATTKLYVDGILGSATSAAASAAAAAVSASNAATSESNASTSASNASTSASNAATSATNAAASYDAFDDRYLGSKTSAPTLDNDGNALLTGALYWNSTSSELYLWTGSAWTRSALSGTDYVAKSGDTMTGALTTTALTLSGGTANGVAYLNGSKVLTSGSALTFDGNALSVLTSNANPLQVSSSNASATLIQHTNSNASADLFYRFRQNAGAGNFYDLTMEGSTNAFTIDYNDSERFRIDSSGNVGIGTSSPAGKLGVDGASFFGNQASTGTGGTFRIVPFGGDVYLQTGQNTSSGSTSNLIFTTMEGAAERMRLDSSGNLGIGTSSPTEKLTVNGNIKLGTSGTSWIYGPATTGRSIYSNSDSTAYIIAYGSAYGGSNDAGLQFTAGTSNNMVFNSAGNLGLGVTPSAWSSSAKALEIGIYAGFYRNASGITAMSFNSYQNTSNIDTYRVSSNSATKYEMAGGHAWYIAPSGTAGDAISFTQAMTLDASGNLALGTTSAGTRLVLATSDADTAGQLRFARSVDVSYYWEIGRDNNSSGAFIFSNAAGGSKTERARIDSSGTFILKNDYQEQTYTANSSTAITLNITTNGTDQVITLTGTATITMPTAVAGKSFLLKLKTGAGGYTVTWSTVKWPGGTAPTLTSAASKMDIFSFFSDGTNWYGTTVGQNYTP